MLPLAGSRKSQGKNILFSTFLLRSFRLYSIVPIEIRPKVFQSLRKQHCNSLVPCFTARDSSAMGKLRLVAGKSGVTGGALTRNAERFKN